MKSMKNSTGTEYKQRIIFLDYLRIFAFVSVLVGHKFYDVLFDYAKSETPQNYLRLIIELLLPFFKGGGAGVVVFFLVSGYIITYVIQTERPLYFFIKRIFRIYPLYISAVLMQIAADYYITGSTPVVRNVIPQLLLVGDFFSTPYTLGIVEWTLRIEVMFYIFMGVARYFNLTHRFSKLFPWALIFSTISLGVFAPFPSHDLGTLGYFSIYGPFLFLGVFYYLKELNQVGLRILLGFTCLVLIQYYYLISIYQSIWVGHHFALLAFAVFFLSWYYRAYLIVAPSVLFFSDLTYSVYLMHNWAWSYIELMLNKIPFIIFHEDIGVLCVLFLICYALMKFIEKPGVILGGIILKYFRGPLK